MPSVSCTLHSVSHVSVYPVMCTNIWDLRLLILYLKDWLVDVLSVWVWAVVLFFRMHTTWVVVSPHAGWLPIHQDDHERRWRPHLPALCRGDGHHWPAAQAMQMRLWCMSTDPPPIISYRSDCSLPCLRCAPSSNNNCHLTLQICVWCWHHIIDMAEKEETEGRCPACRTRYDKDRIVKMAATCDRSVTMLLFLPINFCSASADYNICDDYPQQTTTFAIDYPFIYHGKYE